MSNIRSQILGLGTCVPSRVITNDDLTQWMDTTHEWIVERTGIEEREDGLKRVKAVPSWPPGHAERP